MTTDEFFQQQPWLAAKVAFYQMGMQAIQGIGFDREAAERLLIRINTDMDTIEREIEPQLPRTSMTKVNIDFWRIPAKPFNKDGSLSAVMQKWLVKVNGVYSEGSIAIEGAEYPCIGGEPTKTQKPMELSDKSEALKNWLLSLGWEPVFWNWKKDGKTGKKERDERGQLIKTSPKISDKHEVCPNLEKIGGEFADIAKKLALYFSLRNRRGTLKGKEDDKGWLNNPRLDYDGRLSAGSHGLTPTFRQKHSTVANIVKNKESVVMGKEFRSLFRAPEGKVLVGWDASGLEDRLKGHYTYKFDGGAYAAKILDPNYDVHQEAADAWGMERQDAKPGIYALAYKCGVGTLAATLKCPQKDAKRYWEAYWELNKPMKMLDDKLKEHWETWGDRKWIKGLDGRKILTRGSFALVNNILQSAGAIVMDYSIIWLDKQLGGVYHCPIEGPHYKLRGHVAKRCAYIHDELVFETDPEIAQEIADLGTESIRWAGRYFKLNVPLESKAAIGQTWADLK